MALRSEPVVNFGERPEVGPLRRVVDVLQALFGKVSAFVDVALLLEAAGFTVTNAAGGAGTALAVTRTIVNFGDAGIDNVRVVVYGNNSGAGSVTVQVYDVSGSTALASVSVTGVTPATTAGSWTTIIPTGTDRECEVRVIGNGADDPVLYTVHLQGRTVQARS